MTELYKKIGKLLKLERERQALTLEDLSVQLKIAKSNLEHIEQGEADALPSELYFNLFAKSYAEALGIDYTKTVEAIKEDLGEPLEPSGYPKESKKGVTDSGEAIAGKEIEPVSDRKESKANNLKIWISVFAAIIVLFFIFLLVNKLFFSSGEVVTPTEEQVEAPAESSLVGNQAEPERGSLARYTWEVTPYQKPPELEMQLVAKEKSWATVLADGDTAIFRTLTPGRVYKVKAKYRFLVSIAVPSIVNVELNGQPVDIRSPNKGRISRVEINQTNLDSFLNSPARTIGNNSNANPLSSLQVQSIGSSTSLSSGVEAPGAVEKDVDSTQVNWKRNDEP